MGYTVINLKKSVAFLLSPTGRHMDIGRQMDGLTHTHTHTHTHSFIPRNTHFDRDLASVFMTIQTKIGSMWKAVWLSLKK